MQVLSSLCVARRHLSLFPKRCTLTTTWNSFRHFSDTSTVPSSVLKGSCGCGSVGFEGRGPSAINFVCHCSICRKASGLPSLPAAGFKEENIVWVNESNIKKVTPENSKNARYYCQKCDDYIGEDATRPLGIFAVPLHKVKGDVADCYKPNHHIFYEFRAENAPSHDRIPKWRTLPEGELYVDSPNSNSSTLPTGTGVPYKSGSLWDSKTGWHRKDVQPLSPTRAPESKVYHFVENDPIPNHVSYISPEKVAERVKHKYLPSPGPFVLPKKKKYGAIVIGGGHNGLVSANYLVRGGIDTLVLERRHLVGGAAVTEELYPGFKFSRASYLAGLLRPSIITELELARFGFKYLPRSPTSFTPSLLDSNLKGKYLMLGAGDKADRDSIAQFSKKDAENYPKYDEFLHKVRGIVQPLLDMAPPTLSTMPYKQKLDTLKKLTAAGKVAWKHRDVLVPFYELFTAPASHILDRWFESEILKTTLATDAVIGAMCSPKHNGSAYVLLHHVMGEAAGREGVWSYVQGGMGAISNALARSAEEKGAEIAVNAHVKRILYTDNIGNSNNKASRVRGVEMMDGTVLEAPIVLSNATPYHTFLELLPGLSRDSGNTREHSPLPADFSHHIRFADYACGAVKINCAVKELPNFLCCPTDPSGQPGPQHRGTIHFETRMEEIENAQREAAMGIPATRPVVEMTIPSSLDKTISPPGQHVVQLFIQFAPYEVDPKVGNWADPKFKENFADRIFRIIDEYAPNFSSSVLYRDILSPLDLERIFGLHRGNIMHGSLGIHQLFFARPAFGYSDHRTPIEGLYLCGSGAHPGGGVMGAAGRNCAHIVLGDKK